jgi:hypothetical protein
MNSFVQARASATSRSYDDEEPQLRALYRTRRWFELRAATLGMNEENFYTFAVSCAFNRADEHAFRLRQYLETATSPWQRRELHRLLSWVQVRKGNFARALEYLAAERDPKPTDDDLAERWPLFATLARLPQQAVLDQKACGVPCELVDGNLFVAAQVNGYPLNCMVDSGANISFMTETTARRLGMQIHPLPPNQCRMLGATGAYTSFEASSAEDVRLGSFHLTNVTFLILKDAQLDFPVSYGSAIGLTVLLALKSICWEPNGHLQIGGGVANSTIRAPNICFDDADPIIRASIHEGDLMLLLDTGSGRTTLGQPFAKRFPCYLTPSTTIERMQIHGVSGSTGINCLVLEDITMRIGSTDLVLSPAHLLSQNTIPKSRWLCGSLGIDLLQQATRMTIDFGSMTLALE